MCRQSVGGEAYPKELDVVQNMVVERKVVAGDDIDAGILLDVPVFLPQALALTQKLIAGELSTPVGLGGFLEVTIDSHARETQDGSVEGNGQQIVLRIAVAGTGHSRLNHLG